MRRPRDSARGSGRFLTGRLWAILPMVVALAACATRPPVFEPVPVNSSAGAHDVVVQIQPIDTQLGSEDRRRYGVDFTAYFSAFRVRVENRSPHPLVADLTPSTLGPAGGPVTGVLSDEELVRLYRRGGMDEGAVELIAKAPAVVKREIEQIRAARMPAGRVDPGGQLEGVLFFRPPPGPNCAPSVLTIQGIELLDEPQRLEFAFPLDPCGRAERNTQ
ncbi:MAG: hypothetical protein ACOYXU_02755 [Nitrospirota bacterium]